MRPETFSPHQKLDGRLSLARLTRISRGNIRLKTLLDPTDVGFLALLHPSDVASVSNFIAQGVHSALYRPYRSLRHYLYRHTTGKDAAFMFT